MAVRGISEAAVSAHSAVLDTNYTADEVYDKNNRCEWSAGSYQSGFWSLNMVRPGHAPNMHSHNGDNIHRSRSACTLELDIDLQDRFASK